MSCVLVDAHSIVTFERYKRISRKHNKNEDRKVEEYTHELIYLSLGIKLCSIIQLAEVIIAQNTFLINCSFLLLGVNINRFKAVLTTAIHDLESMGDLHLNATLLSRLIYRMKSKFRNDKGLKCMMKLNRALLNYYNMSLKKEYRTLQSDLRMEDGMYVLPSRQSLEYVLVRTQGFGKLFTRMEEISKYTSYFLRARIKLGHAWSVALIAYATTSRIWYYIYK